MGVPCTCGGRVQTNAYIENTLFVSGTKRTNGDGGGDVTSNGRRGPGSVAVTYHAQALSSGHAMERYDRDTDVQPECKWERDIDEML